MVEIVASLSKKRAIPIFVLGVTDIQHKMLSGCFKGCILSRCGSYDVVGSGYKFIHCDLTYKVGFLTITLIVGVAFVTTFSPPLNVGSFIWVQNFAVTFHNKFEKGDWSLVLRVGTTIMIEQIDSFLLDLRFVTTHSI